MKINTVVYTLGDFSVLSDTGSVWTRRTYQRSNKAFWEIWTAAGGSNPSGLNQIGKKERWIMIVMSCQKMNPAKISLSHIFNWIQNPQPPHPPPPSPFHCISQLFCSGKMREIYKLQVPPPPPSLLPSGKTFTNSFFSKLISTVYNYCHSCGEQSLSNDRIERTCWEISCFATKCAFVSKQPSRTDKEIGQTFDILKENC